MAATADAPAKHDGCAIFAAFKNASNHNDASRQSAAAEAEKKRLEIKLPDNATSSQYAKLVNKFITDVEPYLDPRLPDRLVTEWVLSRMPSNLIDRRDAIKSSLRDSGELADTAKAIQLCRAAIDDRHDPDLGVPDVDAALSKKIECLVAAEKIFRYGLTYIQDEYVNANASNTAGKPPGKPAPKPRERKPLEVLPGGARRSTGKAMQG